MSCEIKNPTNNPLCSDSIKDLKDNAIIMDQYINSQELEVDDRLGEKRKTWAGIEKDAQDEIDGFEQLIDDKIIAQGGIEIAQDWGNPPSPDKVLSQEFIRENLGYVTPEMFGAVGDGVADDYLPLQEALDIASASGKILVLGVNKTYAVKSNLLVRSGTVINMNNSTIYRDFYSTSAGVTFINFVGSVENVHIFNGTLDNNKNLDKNGNIITSISSKNVHFYNVTFKYVTDVHALDICDYENITVENCTFEGFRFTTKDREHSEAIQIDPGYHTDSETLNKNLKVLNCSFIPPTDEAPGYGAWGVGVGNHSLNTHKNSVDGVHIENCDFSECTRAGVRVYCWSNVKILNNRFTQCRRGIDMMTGTGSKIEGSTNVVVKGNAFNNNWVDIQFNSVSTNFSESPLADYAHRNIIFERNEFSDADEMGILIKNTKGIKITNNIFNNSSIQLHKNNYVYIEDMLIQGNTFHESKVTFWQSKSSFVTIKDNVFYSSGGRLVRMYGDGGDNFNNMLVTNNRFYTDTEDALVFDMTNTDSNDVEVSRNYTNRGKITLYSGGSRCKFIDNIFDKSWNTAPILTGGGVFLHASFNVTNVDSPAYKCPPGSTLNLYNTESASIYYRKLNSWVPLVS